MPRTLTPAAETEARTKSKNDGSIYAEGCAIMVAPKETPAGVTLGGPIAEAQNAETAQEIARRCDAFPDMLEALRDLVAWSDARRTELLPKGPGGSFMDDARAAILKAEARS